MFGSLRKKATQESTSATRQLVGALQMAHGIPIGFWQDEFVIGFFANAIAVCSRVSSNERLTLTDKGYVLGDVFTNISNSNGPAIVRRYTEMVFQNPRDSVFQLGLDYGEIVAFALFGKMSEQGKPHIEEAKRLAAEQGKQRDSGAVTSILLENLFLRPIEERFSLR